MRQRVKIVIKEEIVRELYAIAGEEWYRPQNR